MSDTPTPAPTPAGASGGTAPAEMPGATAPTSEPGATGGLPEAAPTPPEPPPVKPVLEPAALDQLFREARTFNKWSDRPVTDDQIRQLHDLLKQGPTSANSSPARFVFLRTSWAKDRLKPALSAGNVEKTMSAPVTVIVAHDPKFYDHLSRLFPHADAKPWFTANPALAEETALRNGTLQGAYLILAARALGLDAGPMSGFDRAKVDETFLWDRGWKSNFLVNLGYGDAASLQSRLPRFFFDEVCLLQ